MWKREYTTELLEHNDGMTLAIVGGCQDEGAGTSRTIYGDSDIVRSWLRIEFGIEL